MTDSTTSPQAPEKLHVGMLLLDSVQLLDTSPIDLFGMLTPNYLQACGLPDHLVKKGIDIEFHYIAEAQPGKHVSLTAGAKYVVTVGSEGSETCEVCVVGK